jgi:hypothetical protein
MGIKEKVDRWSDIAASKYAHENKCMNMAIAGAVQREGLNNEHINIGFASKLLSQGYSDLNMTLSKWLCFSQNTFCRKGVLLT